MIIATRGIHNGEEILLNYNKGNGPKYLFNEPGVSHSTVRSRLNTITLSDTDDPSLADAAVPTADQEQGPTYECLDTSNPGHRRQSQRPIAHEPPRVHYSEEQQSQMFKLPLEETWPLGCGKDLKHFKHVLPGTRDTFQPCPDASCRVPEVPEVPNR